MEPYSNIHRVLPGQHVSEMLNKERNTLLAFKVTLLLVEKVFLVKEEE